MKKGSLYGKYREAPQIPTQLPHAAQKGEREGQQAAAKAWLGEVQPEYMFLSCAFLIAESTESLVLH